MCGAIEGVALVIGTHSMPLYADGAELPIRVDRTASTGSTPPSTTIAWWLTRASSCLPEDRGVTDVPDEYTRLTTTTQSVHAA